MINYKPKHGDMEMWLILAAMNHDFELLDKMKVNPDGTYPVKFEVGGVELDFSKVAERIDKEINEMIKEKAEKLLNEKYNSLIEEIYDIQERLEEQKNNLFKHE